MIPLATTSIALIELNQGDDTIAPGAGVTTITGIPAHLSAPTGREASAETVDKVLYAEPIPTLTHRHVVFDETTHDRWQVIWVDQRQGLGLDHTVAGVTRIRGAG